MTNVKCGFGKNTDGIINGLDYLMFLASSIKKLILDKLGLEVLGIQENFQGCDQNVWIITTSNSNNEKIVLKHPKNEVYLRIMREVLACELFQRIAINVPRILYWDNEILIETFIVGQLLDKIKFENVSQFEIFLNLGKILHKIHSISAVGFGKIKSMKLIGEFPDQDSYFNQGFLEDMNNLENTGIFSQKQIQNIKDHYENNKKMINKKKSVLLHADFADSNIFLTPMNEITLIDFADLSAGNPMQDFAYMYETYYGTPAFDALMEGYQEGNLPEIEFFAFCRFIWLIPLLWKNKKNHKRVQRILQLFNSMLNPK